MFTRKEGTTRMNNCSPVLGPQRPICWSLAFIRKVSQKESHPEPEWASCRSLPVQAVAELAARPQGRVERGPRCPGRLAQPWQHGGHAGPTLAPRPSLQPASLSDGTQGRRAPSGCFPPDRQTLLLTTQFSVAPWMCVPGRAGLGPGSRRQFPILVSSCGSVGQLLPCGVFTALSEKDHLSHYRCQSLGVTGRRWPSCGKCYEAQCPCPLSPGEAEAGSMAPSEGRVQERPG